MLSIGSSMSKRSPEKMHEIGIFWSSVVSAKAAMCDEDFTTHITVTGHHKAWFQTMHNASWGLQTFSVTMTPRLQWHPAYSNSFGKSHITKKCDCKQKSAFSDTLPLSWGCHCNRGFLYYRDEIYSLQILLSRTQSGPGWTVKEQQEHNSPNHVQRINLISVH